MIKLKKEDQPQILIDNAANWTQILLSRIANNEKPTDAERSRYRHADIKKILIVETSGKCAYCESKILHITYGDVEHISPKSSNIELSFLWENLTLACDVCNTRKSNHFPDGLGFVDPYVTDPRDRFFIEGPFIFGKIGDVDARLTEETLGLNRPELFERRAEKIKNLRNQLEFLSEKPEPLKGLLLTALRSETTKDAEFSAIASSFLQPLLG